MVGRARIFTHCLAIGAFALFAAVVTTGCVDIEHTIVVNKDFTGTAGFKVTMDMEMFPMLMLQMQRAVHGRSDSPTSDELADMKRSLAAELGDGVVDVEALKTNLPAGVTMTTANQKLDGLKLVMDFSFSFTDITKLPEIALSPRAGVGGTGRRPGKPFQNLEIKIDNDTLVITTTEQAAPSAPGPDTVASADAVWDLLKQLQDPQMRQMFGPTLDMMMYAMNGSREAIRIDSPLTVVETNATTRNGTVMLWEQKLDSLDVRDVQKLDAIKPLSVSLTLKKG